MLLRNIFDISVIGTFETFSGDKGRAVISPKPDLARSAGLFGMPPSIENNYSRSSAIA
jgi:hypothetical protein